MVCRWHGLVVSSDEIRKHAGLQFGEASLLDLKKAAESLGFRTSSLRLGLEALKDRCSYPVIVHFPEGQYAVLSGASKSQVDLEDPGMGRYRLPWKVFGKRWLEGESGVLLEVTPVSTDRPPSLPESREQVSFPGDHPSWTTRSLWTAALLGLTTLLWLRWVELLFSAVAIRLLYHAFLPVLSLTLLLGIAAFSLVRRWQLEVRREVAATPALPAMFVTGHRDTSGYWQEWVSWWRVREARLRFGWHALLAGSLQIVLMVYVAFGSPLFSAFLFMITVSMMAFAHWQQRSWLGATIGSLEEESEVTPSLKLELFPQGSVALSFFLALIAWCLICWTEGAAAEFFLSGFLALSLWALCLGYTISGIRARTLIWWGGATLEASKPSQVKFLGDIRLLVPVSSSEMCEVLVPQGKTTLLLAQDEQAAAHWMDLLSAKGMRSGSELSVGGILLGSRARLEYRKRIGEMRADGSIKLPEGVASCVAIKKADSREGSWTEVEEFMGRSWVSNVRSLLFAGADHLFLHLAMPSLDPFRRLVVMEQVISQKGASTLILATDRTEAAASADWVILLHQGEVVAQGRPSEILGRPELADFPS